MSENVAITVDAARPWLGLLPFREEHREFFFGRDAEVTEILQRIQENTLTILFGQSGLGKSSLLGAGVVPRLRESDYAPVYLRLGYLDTSPPLLEQTREAFRRALPEDRWPEDAAELSLWEIFHRQPSVLEGAKVPVLVFDQFEEIFTLGRQSPEREAEAAEWLVQMADLLQNRPPKELEDRFAENRKLARGFDFSPVLVRVIFALREDFLSHLEGWKTRLPLLTQNRMGLNLLNGPQALEAVLGPATLGDTPLVSREVAAGIVRTVAKAPDETPLAGIKAVPPLLSLLCERLNEARLAVGAVEISPEMAREQSADILQRFYEDSFNAFPEKHREVIRSLVEDPPMVTEGGFRNSLVREDAEAELARRGVEKPAEVFDLLIARRLITADEKDGLQRLEITHDVLVPLVVRSRKERRDREAAERRRKERKKLATVVAGLMLLVAVFAGLAVWALGQKRRADQQKEIAAERLTENEKTTAFLRSAEAEQLELLKSASYGDHEAALRAFGEGRRAEGLAYLERALRLWPENVPAACLAMNRLADGFRVRSVARFEDRVTCLAFSPDGRWLAAGSQDKTLRVVEAATVKEISRTEFGSTVYSVSFSPDGRWLAAGSGDNTLRVVEAATGKEISRTEFGSTVYSVSFSPDGRWLAAGSFDETLRVVEAAAGKEISRTEFESVVDSVSFSPDGRWLAAASGDDTLRVVEAATGKEISRAEFGHPVNSLSFSPDGRWLAAGSRDKTLRVLEAATGKEISRTEFEDWVTSVSFNADGRWLAAGSGDNTLRVSEAATGKEISRTEFGDYVTSVSFSADGRWLAAGSGDNTLRVLEAATGKEISRTEFQSVVDSLSFSPDGRWLAAGSRDKTLRVVEAVTGKEISRNEFEDWVTSVSFSPDSRWLAAGSVDKTLRVLEGATGKEISRTEFGDDVTSISFSPDGRWLVAGSRDKTLRVVEAATGKEMSRTEFGGHVTSVSFSPDSRWLAAGSGDRTLRVVDWNLKRSVSAAVWLPDTILVHLGCRFDDGGKRTPLSGEEWDRISRKSALHQSEVSLLPQLLEWITANPDTRKIAIGDNVTVRESVGLSLMWANTQGIVDWNADRAPWHPLVPVSLARIVTNEPSLPFLCNLTLQRLRDADAEIYGAETLAGYAAKSAEWMGGFGLPELGLKAVEEGLRRVPGHQGCLEMKQKLEEIPKTPEE